MTASSDKVGASEKQMNTGEAITLQSSHGKYRVVLTALEANYCWFGLVKD
jgi:hypothetical protein